MSNKPSIDVQRRRKGSQPTGQAEAPRRPAGGTGGSTPRPAGGGGSPYRPSGGGGGFSLPRGGKLGGAGGCLVMILVIAYVLLGGGGENPPADLPAEKPLATQAQPVAENRPTNTPRPTRTAAPAAPGQTGQSWLVMLYQDADDQILEQDIFLDLNEAEKVGSSDRVTIVAQVDRYRGAFQGDGNWTSTRRYLVQQDDDLATIGSELVDDLGEVNMADGATLVEFATWAMKTYPAERYVLILSDHGMGWPGGWSDPAPGGRDSGNAPLINALSGDHLYLAEIDTALGEILQQAGVEQFDIIGMDACLMSQMEVYTALQPHARYAIASEETEPALGWAYTSFLQALVDHPDMEARDLAAAVVDSYIEQDQRIVDDQARSEFLRQGSPMGGFFGVQDIGAARLADQIQRSSTLTAVDLETLPGVLDAFNQFAYSLQDEDQAAVARARTYAQSYTSIFGEEVPPSYIDLGHFAQLVAQKSSQEAVAQASEVLVTALGDFVVAEKHGSNKPGSTGVAIYFPNSTMYRSPHSGPQSYNAIATRFAKTSLWDDFLAFHYNDRAFEADAAEPVAPSAGMASRAPGAGRILISNLTASRDTIAPNQSIRLSAEINGQNIGYVYLFIGFYDPISNSVFVADTDFLESPDTREVGGVYYPVWPEGEAFDLNFEWDGTLFSISDGTNTVLALFDPLTYGASAEQAVYVVNGKYTFADTGEERYAQLHFIDGKLAQVFGFDGPDQTGAPREITPSEGDTFTMLQKWLDIDANGKVTQSIYESGDLLTFSRENSFTWVMEYAPTGQYLIGFIASDLDGNTSQAFTQIQMQ